MSTLDKHQEDKEEETPEGAEECENRKMEKEKRWHSYWVSPEVSMGEGKRNNRLELIENKEFTEGEEVRGMVKREGSLWQKGKKLMGMQKYEKARRGWVWEKNKSREEKNTGFSTEYVSRKLPARSPLLRNNSVLHKWLIPSFTPGHRVSPATAKDLLSNNASGWSCLAY